MDLGAAAGLGLAADLRLREGDFFIVRGYMSVRLLSMIQAVVRRFQMRSAELWGR